MSDTRKPPPRPTPAGKVIGFDPARLRGRLVPLWVALHRTWSDPVPVPPSRFMCRYTAELVALLDPGWVTVLGRVDGATHAWNECRAEGLFCDLTGDQFARPAVQLRVGRPPGYVEHHWTDSDPAAFQYRATEWLRKIPVEAYSIRSDTPILIGLVALLIIAPSSVGRS